MSAQGIPLKSDFREEQGSTFFGRSIWNLNVSFNITYYGLR
jgi:hypothetical protein